MQNEAKQNKKEQNALFSQFQALKKKNEYLNIRQNEPAKEKILRRKTKELNKIRVIHVMFMYF